MKIFRISLLAVFFLVLSDSKITAASGDVFRVTEYTIGGSDFSGATYDLALDQSLSADHFILIRGSASGGNTQGADNSYARVSALPAGMNRELPVSGADNILTLSRFTGSQDWRGTVTVVECLQQCDTKGFRLRDVLDLATNDTETSGSISSSAWTNEDNVVPFGGVFGSGSIVEYSGSKSQNRYASAWVRLLPAAGNTIDWNRYDGGGKGLVTARHTIHVVEWGSEWSVQRSVISGASGGNGVNSTSEYDTDNISPVSRANTWVWGTGMSQDAGIGDGSEAIVLTLGNGVDQNPIESTVAVGSEYTAMRHFAVYTMTHPDLLVDSVFKTDGDRSNLTLDIPLSLSAPVSQRMAWNTNTCNGTGTAFPRPVMSASYIDDSTIRLERQYSGQNFAAWVQGIDFSAFFIPGTALGVNFVDSLGNPVISPSVDMSVLNTSLFSQVTHGTLGTASSRIHITASETDLEWSLSLAPTDGSSALWTGTSENYDVNDSLSTGLDGPDPDGFGGQMSVDFSGASATPNAECASATTLFGSNTAFLEGSVDSIFLASSQVPSAGGDCTWDIEGIDLHQVIPPEQPSGNYSLDMVLTVTAI